MAEEHQDTESKDTETPKEPTEVTFSDAQQEKLNEIISTRLAERDAKHQRELDAIEKKHQKEMEMSKMDEETRHRAEEAEKLKEFEQRAQEAERKLRISDARTELAKVGLDESLAETLMGETEEQTTANIGAVMKAAKAMADKMYAERVGSTGSPRAPESAGTSDLMSKMRLAAGLPPERA